jgi:hypothetical protein
MFRHTLVFLFGLCLANTASASWADPLFEELSRDFGTVPRGPTLTHPFRLTNKTRTPLHIAGVRVSCGCTSASILREDLEPGQSTAILAQMDTRRFLGEKSVTIYVTFDRPQWDEVHLVVHANSREDIMLTPDSLAFPAMRRGTSPTASLSVSFLGSPWRIVGVQSESNYVIPTLKETSHTENGDVSYQLNARIRPDVPAGKWYTDIWLTTNNPAVPRLRVPLTVEVQTALTVSPSLAALGAVKAGETVERKVVVRGGKPFRILAIKGADGQLVVQDSTRESKPVHVLSLVLKAHQAGEQTWNLRVLTDMKEDSEVQFQAQARVLPNAAAAAAEVRPTEPRQEAGPSLSNQE